MVILAASETTLFPLSASDRLVMNRPWLSLEGRLQGFAFEDTVIKQVPTLNSIAKGRYL